MRRQAGKKLYEPVDPADVRDPTEAELLYRHAMTLPARAEIERVLQTVEDLGLDRHDPRIIKRAIRAGHIRLLRVATMSVERTRREGDRGEHDPVVYYMRLGTMVKIGTSCVIGNRASSINPEEILAVEWGDSKVEAQRHAQFADLRSHGEWFRYEEPVRQHVAAIRQTWEQENGASVDEWLRSRTAARRRRATDDLPG